MTGFIIWLENSLHHQPHFKKTAAAAATLQNDRIQTTEPRSLALRKQKTQPFNIQCLSKKQNFLSQTMELRPAFCPAQPSLASIGLFQLRAQAETTSSCPLSKTVAFQTQLKQQRPDFSQCNNPPLETQKIKLEQEGILP